MNILHWTVLTYLLERALFKKMDGGTARGRAHARTHVRTCIRIRFNTRTLLHYQ